MAYKHGPQVRLVSRSGRDHTDRFGDLAAIIAALPAHTLILDGEVCVFDEDLVSQFHLLGEPTPTCWGDATALHGRPLRELVFPVRRLAANGPEAWFTPPPLS